MAMTMTGRCAWLALAGMLFVGLIAGAARGAPLAAQSGHSALWIDPSRDGEGWMLEVLEDGAAVLYWFTYDEDGGQRWLIGVGHDQDGDLAFPELVVTRGGRFGEAFDPDDVIRESAGSARIRFQDCQRGEFEFTAFDQAGTLSMVRLSSTLGVDCDGSLQAPIPAHAGQSGSWYAPHRDGEGFGLQWLDRDHAVVVWYTYDALGAQQWMLGVGAREDNRLVIPTMTVTRGARFGAGFDPAAVERLDWGALHLDLACDSADVTWLPESPLVPAGGTSLVPLTRLQGLSCPFASPDLADLQDADWDTRFFIAGVSGMDGFAPTVYDFTEDPAGDLLVAGYFRWHGQQPVPPVMRLREGAWAPVRAGQFGDAFMVTALNHAPDGRLAVATDRDIRVDDGDSLRPVASLDGLVRRLLWHDGELWAAGWFSLGDGLDHLARWDGESWRAPPGGPPDGPVYALYADGEALLVGGAFDTVGGIAAVNLARLAQGTWSAMDLPGRVLAVQRTAEGLFVGGSLVFDGTRSGGIARRVDEGWVPVGPGFSLGPLWGVVHALALHQGQLHAFGCFSQTGEGAAARPLADIARWNGEDWLPLGDTTSMLQNAWFSPGLCGFEPAPWVPWYVGSQRLHSVGDVLYLGGAASGQAATPSQSLIGWRDDAWEAQGAHGLGFSGTAGLLALDPEGRVYAFGPSAAGNTAGQGTLFRFEGDRWLPLGPDLPPDTGPCTGMAFGSGGQLHLACSHQPRLPNGDDDPHLWRARLLRLDDDGWTELGAGHGLRPPTAMVRDGGGRLWMAGGLLSGAEASGYLARLDGERLTIIEDRFDSLVLSLAVAPTGEGEDVVVSGHFLRIGAAPFQRIARLRGDAWEPLGPGLAVAAGTLLHEGDRILAAAGSDSSEVGTRMTLGLWHDGSWRELATADSGFPDTATTLPTIHAMVRRGDRLYLAGNMGGESAGSHALVLEDGRFRVLGGGLHATGGAVSLLATDDAVWFGGAIAEVGSGDGRRPSVGIARLAWDRK